MADPVPCDSCAAKGTRALIILVLVANNAGRRMNRMPLNADPDPDGNVAVRRNETGTLLGRVLAKDRKPAGGETVYMPHFATCINPRAHRRRERKHEARSKAGQPARRPAPTQPTLDIRTTP